MDYIIEGGKPLYGEINVYGAKNCALTLLGASVLTDDEIVLSNCPDIVDVDNMVKILRHLGKKIVRSNDMLAISGGLSATEVDRDLATLLRGSALILGSVLARYHKITLPLPGGCAIGARPMDIHIDGLRAMGVHVNCTERELVCVGTPVSTTYKLRFASVGATENLLCACVFNNGRSVLQNCAIEPEVVALEHMLAKMGAKIYGIGTPQIVIDGVSSLHGAAFTVIPDRIVAATYLSAIVAAGGDVTIQSCNPAHLCAFTNILQSRFEIRIYESAIRLIAHNQPKDYGHIVTAPYPLFPTDMQSLLLSLAAFSDGGVSVIEEMLFESRLSRNVSELTKMGANVDCDGRVAKIVGSKLHGAEVIASDLRGGAGLVVAALNASGRSIVSGVEHINRGYVNLAANFKTLGAEITLR